MKATVLFFLSAILLVGAVGAVEPPGYVNYQGVLRDASDDPIGAPQDMVFRFYDAETGGVLLLTDSHTGSQNVPVDGGLFNVRLGEGAITPGLESTLSEVFARHTAVYLEVQVGSETLSPRTRLVAAGFALNADRLDGMQSVDFANASHGHAGSDITGPVSNSDMVDGLHAANFLDTSASTQSKQGMLYLNGALDSTGPSWGGHFSNASTNGWAYMAFAGMGIYAGGTTQAADFRGPQSRTWVAWLDHGIYAKGDRVGGFFELTGGTASATLAYSNRGIEAQGTAGGGYFHASDGSGYAYTGLVGTGIAAGGTTRGGDFSDNDQTGRVFLAEGDIGIRSEGSAAGGTFTDTDGTSSANLAEGDRGIMASGNSVGGYFYDRNSSGFADVGYGDQGIYAAGNTCGGYFIDRDGSSLTYVANNGYGIEAYGPTSGGYFDDRDGTGSAFVGYGDRGIEASGASGGGYFWDTNNSGRAYVAVGDTGVQGSGNSAGGYFEDIDSSGYANVGTGDYGIQGWGNYAGAYFRDLDHSGYAYMGFGNRGIQAYGSSGGGYFDDTDSTGYAYAAEGDQGIQAGGSVAGGYFTDTDNGSWARVAYSTYKIYGNPISTSFVQNHPVDKDTVIVFSAPEGDEVGVYTRGTARLKEGEARVPLGPTFKWVTNPDIGLTVHLTPIGAWSDLYVVSKGTEEIVVRSGGGDPNAAFDYVVYGLRIGFEESGIVQEKIIESYIPSMKDHRQLYERRPELRTFNAQERFKAMQEAAALPASDFTRANELKAAVHEYDPATDPPACELLGMGPCPEAVTSSLPRPGQASGTADTATRRERERSGATSLPTLPTAPVYAGARPNEDGATKVEAPVGTLFPVSEWVEAGDLVVLDSAHPGLLARAATAGDRGVVGIAAGQASTTADGALEAPVAVYGVVQVKVDAAFGVVRAGDLLVTSATPGHAMKSPEPLAAGTVIGKALEALENGTGLIKVVMMLR